MHFSEAHLRAWLKKGLVWIGTGLWWLAGVLWGETIEAWIRSMIPSQFHSPLNVLTLAVIYGPPIVLIGIGAYLFVASQLRQTPPAHAHHNGPRLVAAAQLFINQGRLLADERMSHNIRLLEMRIDQAIVVWFIDPVGPVGDLAAKIAGFGAPLEIAERAPGRVVIRVPNQLLQALIAGQRRTLTFEV